MAHQVSSNLNMFPGNNSTATQDFNPVVVTTHAPTFTPDQYQQLFALIGSSSTATQQTTTGQDSHMANTVALPSKRFKHSAFSAKVVNKRAYGIETWVINTGATDHIVRCIY